jgi:hypothetical protein
VKESAHVPSRYGQQRNCINVFKIPVSAVSAAAASCAACCILIDAQSVEYCAKVMGTKERVKRKICRLATRLSQVRIASLLTQAIVARSGEYGGQTIFLKR